MDEDALRFIETRQTTLREAYDRYNVDFPPLQLEWSHDPSSEHANRAKKSDIPQGIWAWRKWDSRDVSTLVRRCLQENDELYQGLNSPSSRERLEASVEMWIVGFLSDRGSMFRIYRKSRFNVTTALENLQDVLVFRILNRDHITWIPNVEHANADSHSGKEYESRGPAQSPRSSPVVTRRRDTSSKSLRKIKEGLIRMYPASTMDPNRRPVLVVSLSHLEGASSRSQPHPKVQVMAALEQLRLYLVERAGQDDVDPLQLILILNLAGGRITSTAWEMVRWLARDAVEYFHGLISAVFVVNYSWEFGAAWSFIKRALPASAKARVMFPTQDDLLDYLGSDSLPPSLGGTQRESILYPPVKFPSEDELEGSSIAPESHPPKPAYAKPIRPTLATIRLHRTSSENPYFGYPTIRQDGFTSAGRPIYSTRRRKRDLVRTLIWLLWSRIKADSHLLINTIWYHRWTSTLVFLGVLLIILRRRSPAVLTRFLKTMRILAKTLKYE